MGGHFHLPPQWFRPTQIDPAMYSNISQVWTYNNFKKKHSYTLLYIYLSPVSDNDQIFEFVMSLFVAVSVALLRFVAIFALFGRLWAKLVFFWVKKKCFFLSKKCCLFVLKTVLFGQEMHCYMVFIPYYTEQNLQICNYAQK